MKRTDILTEHVFMNVQKAKYPILTRINCYIVRTYISPNGSVHCHFRQGTEVDIVYRYVYITVECT